jgi:hypothetical protein
LTRNGSASADGREEAKTLPGPTAETPPNGDKKRSAKRRTSGHRAAGRGPHVIRYFVGKGSDPKPMLEQEVASEAEALVVAFKSDGLVFLVQEFTVAQKIEPGRVSLEKQAAPVQRVSTTNAS